MENEISNEYIENAINELEKFFGVKEPVLSKDIFLSIRSGKVKDAIKLIARQFGLPIDINITNVPNDYRSQNDGNQFHSTHLAKVHQHGSGSEGITAQVTIPGSLPFYGSSALNGYPINVKISDNCTEHPVVFAMIMAHELSHILLYSLSHPKKENEFYTDLTAIMLGFQNIFKNGRKITTTEEEPGFMSTTIRTQTTTYGYLTDNQFNFVRNKIDSILRETRNSKKNFSKKIVNYERLLSVYKKNNFKFAKFLDYLYKNHDKKITGEDGKKIVLFYQPGYIEDRNIIVKNNEEKREKMRTLYDKLFYYANRDTLKKYNKEIEDIISYLKKKLYSLRDDVKAMRKYVSIFYRLKINLNVFFNKSV